MSLNKINSYIDLMKESPIRAYLNNKSTINLSKDKEIKKVTIFDDEKKIIDELDDRIQASMESIDESLKVVVMGEVKAGKSTLINSILQKKVAYTNVVEATAAILEIEYANKDDITICYKSKQEKVASLDELNNLLDKNRNNQEFFSEIQKIHIKTNTARLKEITVVDTPGLNTVTKENANRTADYIKKADVILWVINVHNLGQSDVFDSIDDVLEYGKPIIGVVNRVDEVDGDLDEIFEYVQDNMGYMFEEIFMTSAQKAWGGFLNNIDKCIEESNINELYSFITENIEKNTDDVKLDSVLKSVKAQLKINLSMHNYAKFKLESLLKRMEEDKNSFRSFNNNTKKVVDNKIDDWFDMQFFEFEKNNLLTCSDKNDYKSLIATYTSESHINSIIQDEYNNVLRFIQEQWMNYCNDFIKRETESLTFNVNLNQVINIDDASDCEIITDTQIIETVKSTGIAAGTVGLGMAGYSAWLGSAAAYITIGSAIGAFVPPLVLGGIIGGLLYGFLQKGSSKNNNYEQINALVIKVKDFVRKNILGDVKKSLYDASDYYYYEMIKKVYNLLDECNITEDELNSIYKDISVYIQKMELALV